ncbi:MAG: CIA30 family protein [Planctomycetota bacterium]
MPNLRIAIFSVILMLVLAVAHAFAENAPDEHASDDTTAEGHTYVFADFSSDDQPSGGNDRWRMVNDNVMGGRSIGNRSFENGIMTFSGSINTNGGGFASVRIPLDPNALMYTPHADADQDSGGKASDHGSQPTPYTRVQLRIKTDGRPYRLLLNDSTRYQRRNISHRALLTPTQEAASNDEWQTVTISLEDLAPSWRGRAVPDAPPFDPSKATTLGMTLVEDKDGPFTLQIDSITILH